MQDLAKQIRSFITGVTFFEPMSISGPSNLTLRDWFDQVERMEELLRAIAESDSSWARRARKLGYGLTLAERLDKAIEKTFWADNGAREAVETAAARLRSAGIES